MRTIVKTENVKKFYEQTKALQGVSITVHANDFIAVLGKKRIRQDDFISYLGWTDPAG